MQRYGPFDVKTCAHRSWYWPDEILETIYHKCNIRLMARCLHKLISFFLCRINFVKTYYNTLH